MQKIHEWWKNIDLEKFYKWFFLLLALLLGLLLGWLNPNEGPFDYLYDERSSSPAVHRPHRGVPAPAPKNTQIYEDYNEDGIPEWYEIIPLFPIEEDITKSDF